MAYYVPGHEWFAQYAPETVNIDDSNESSDPTIPAIPTDGRVLLGHIQPGDITEVDGQTKGYGSGAPGPVYDQDVLRTYDMSIQMRVASSAFLKRCLRGDKAAGSVNGLPENAILFGNSTSGHALRYAVCNQMQLQIAEGQEITASLQMQAICKEAATLDVPSPSAFVALGAPLFYHDLAGFTIKNIAYRKALSSISFSITHNIVRVGQRPDYQTATDLARCAYELLPHHFTGTGELTFHSRILTANSDWGDIVMTVGAEVWTLKNCKPQQRAQRGADSSAQLSWSCPFSFDDFTIE